MKNIKFMVGIIGLFVVMGFSYGAELYISPNVAGLGKDCIESFDINLFMENGDIAFATDLIMDSNMEFINFENSNLFRYYIPPRDTGNLVHLILFNSIGENLTGGGKIGTLYYKVQGDNPYLRFKFSGVGKTDDTNIAIDGRDILKKVSGGEYSIIDDISCEEYTGYYYLLDDYHNLLNATMLQFESDNSDNNMCVWLCSILGGIVLLVIIVLIIYKRSRKGKSY